MSIYAFLFYGIGSSDYVLYDTVTNVLCVCREREREREGEGEGERNKKKEKRRKRKLWGSKMIDEYIYDF